jgi:hypothetical protein
MQFITWLWTYPQSGRARPTDAIDSNAAWNRVVRLRTPRRIRAWLYQQPDR